MGMLERGIDNDIFRSGNQALKYGMLCVGISVGIMAGAALKKAGVEGLTSFASMVFLFGGIGLIVYHIIIRRGRQ